MRDVESHQDDGLWLQPNQADQPFSQLFPAASAMPRRNAFITERHIDNDIAYANPRHPILTSSWRVAILISKLIFCTNNASALEGLGKERASMSGRVKNCKSTLMKPLIALSSPTLLKKLFNNTQLLSSPPKNKIRLRMVFRATLELTGR